jgi:hypothetical protein
MTATTAQSEQLKNKRTSLILRLTPGDEAVKRR